MLLLYIYWKTFHFYLTRRRVPRSHRHRSRTSAVVKSRCCAKYHRADSKTTNASWQVTNWMTSFNWLSVFPKIPVDTKISILRSYEYNTGKYVQRHFYLIAPLTPSSTTVYPYFGVSKLYFFTASMLFSKARCVVWRLHISRHAI